MFSRPDDVLLDAPPVMRHTLHEMAQQDVNDFIAQAQNDIRVEAEIRGLLGQASLLSRLAILTRLTVETEQLLKNPRDVHIGSANGNEAAAPTIISSVEKMLKDAGSNGITTTEIAAKQYPDREPANGKNVARSMLQRLKDRGNAVDYSDRWYSIEHAPAALFPKRPVAENKNSSRTIGEIIRSSIRNAGKPLTKRDIIEAVQEESPNTTAQHVNSEVYRQVKLENIIKQEDRSGNKLYSLPLNGGTSK
jgi:hypothetical protein